MATPYLGEIRAVGFNFAPSGWAFCNGQLLDISQNDALYSLLGTTYGGNGTTTFGLPNLQGRVPMHQGTSSQMTTVLGQVQGTTQVTLTTATMPAHTHTITVGQLPAGGVVDRQAAPQPTTYLSNSNNDGIYNSTSPTLDATAANGAIGVSGGSQPHENEQPFLVITFCIALQGIYPSQN
jgi:microcystin-dependent protein